MALESLNAPVRSTPPATPQISQLASIDEPEKSDERRQEPTKSEESLDVTRSQAGNAAISEVLRGSIVNLVV